MIFTKKVFRLASSILVLFGFIVLGSCQNRAGSPAARYGARMIYDTVGRQTILFGGRADALFGMKYFNDLWKFDSVSHSWEHIKTTLRPGPRLSPGMVYDPIRHQIIVFGGDSPKDRLGDTWVYSLADNHWQEVTPANSPPPRSDLGLVYDEQNQVVILFSGYCRDDIRESCDDTWAFDPTTNTWTEMKPETSPPIMYGHAMVYDSINHKTILWGGHEATYQNGQQVSHQYGNTIWQYDYQQNSWQQVTATNSPPARYWHQAAFDTSNGTMFLFGGNGANAFLADTWIYDVADRAWHKDNANEHPSPRINPAMSYDPINECFVFFGGMAEGGTDLQDTWVYKGGWGEILSSTIR